MANHANASQTASAELKFLKSIVETLRPLHDQDAELTKALKEMAFRLNALEELLQTIADQSEERKLFEQAKTVLMLRGGLSEHAAHHRIQKASIEQQSKIGVIARNILQVEDLMHDGARYDGGIKEEEIAANAAAIAAATAAALVKNGGKKKNGN